MVLFSHFLFLWDLFKAPDKWGGVKYETLRYQNSDPNIIADVTNNRITAR
jgi:hypothetical protein